MIDVWPYPTSWRTWVHLGFLFKGGCGVVSLGGINASIYAAVLFMQQSVTTAGSLSNVLEVVAWANAILSIGLVLAGLKLAFEYGKLTNQVSTVTSAVSQLHEDLRPRSRPPHTA